MIEYYTERLNMKINFFCLTRFPSLACSCMEYHESEHCQTCISSNTDILCGIQILMRENIRQLAQ